MKRPFGSLHKRNWADLPRELLGLILDRLVLLPDYIRFGAVCKSWLCEARAREQERMRSCYTEPPMLLIPPGQDLKNHQGLYSVWEHKLSGQDVKNHQGLYSVWEHKLYSPGVYIPPYYRGLCGSSYGWLAFEDAWSITLLNPFSRSSIKLPPLMRSPDVHGNIRRCSNFLTGKVILSCDPSLHPKDWVVAATFVISNDEAYDEVVAYLRSGEWSWTSIDHPLCYLRDVCFLKGNLYATDCYSNLITVDFSQKRYKWGGKYGTYYIKSESLVRLPDYCAWFLMTYLVELEGQLLLVGRYYINIVGDRRRTVGFKVYKLNHKKAHLCDSGNAAEWNEIQNLGDFSLFLGINESVSVSAVNFPNFQPNCIYYTRDFQALHHDDLGIFDLSTNHISEYYPLQHSNGYAQDPIWITPKLGRHLLS